MDPQGGGMYVQRELASNRALIAGAETNVTPIVTPSENSVAVAYPILCMWRRTDPDIAQVWPDMGDDAVFNDALYSHVKEGLDTGQFILPKPLHEWDREQTRHWSQERIWSLRLLAEVLADQLQKIIVATTEKDGTSVFKTSKYGGRSFSSRGKKDFVSALLYSYAAFRAWLAGSDMTWFNGAEMGADPGFASLRQA
jgi:hypothetical protein